MLVMIYYFEIVVCVICECVFFVKLDGFCEILIVVLLVIEGDEIYLCGEIFRLDGLEWLNVEGCVFVVDVVDLGIKFGEEIFVKVLLDFFSWC